MMSTSSLNGVLDDVDKNLANTMKTDRTIPEKNYKLELKWSRIVSFTIFHVAALYGFYLAFASAKLASNIFAFILYQFTGIGITAGAHRLWAHRTYKATWQLKLLLTIMNTTAFQSDVITWTREHRVHHKYSDTIADPYNSKRGFFFAHFGWLLCREHPAVVEKVNSIDTSDMDNDPMLAFQKKYYFLLAFLFCFGLPTVIAVYGWNESWLNALLVPGFLRYIIVLHITCLVNSAAHFYGYKPYDGNIRPTNNLLVSILAVGEGWHNYHHVFPWDYKASELPTYGISTTTIFIDFFAWIGWAYDLKTVSSDIIKKRVQRTGDGSHQLWGWGDNDATEKDKIGTIVTNKK